MVIQRIIVSVTFSDVFSVPFKFLHHTRFPQNNEKCQQILDSKRKGELTT